MKCPNCGAEIKEAKFCSYCGFQINININNLKDDYVTNEEDEIDWPVIVYGESGNYIAYDVYSGEETDSYISKNKCKSVISKLIAKFLSEEGYDNIPKIEEIKTNKYYLNLKTYYKDKVTIEYLKLKKCDIALRDDNVKDDVDSELKESSKSKKIYAIVQHRGNKYFGSIPNMVFSNVSFCKTREECINKLEEKYIQKKGGMFDETSEQDLEEIKEENESSEIVVLNVR